MTDADSRRIREVVDFWREAGRAGHWFDKNPEFDQTFRARFLDLHLAAARGQCEHWSRDAHGSLALLILLDQFPRNAFRGTAHMYATDGLALRVARQAIARGHMEQAEPALQLFFCLPFAHSENLADQELSVELNARLGAAARSHAEGHREIIRRFGKFPHRNPLLLRETTAPERAFLAAGGFAG